LPQAKEVEMATILIVVLTLAVFVLALVLRRYENTPLYVILCAAAFVWFLVMTIMKANTGPTHITVLMGLVTLFALWRTITLALRLKRTQNQKPLP
jgi:hypothetical protein